MDKNWVMDVKPGFWERLLARDMAVHTGLASLLVEKVQSLFPKSLPLIKLEDEQSFGAWIAGTEEDNGTKGKLSTNDVVYSQEPSDDDEQSEREKMRHGLAG